MTYSNPNTPTQTTSLAASKQSATRFIEMLHGKVDAKVTFFVVEESGKEKSPQHFHGTLDEHWDRLELLNRANFGIFVLVQKGNGQGRKERDIVGLNALFTDDDNDSPTPPLPLSPSMTVRSKRGCHRYWLLKPGEHLDRLREAQESLATHFGTDPAVKDPSRVMRLPGTLHVKDPSDAFPVELVEAKNVRYTIDEVMQAYPGPSNRPANDNAQAVTINDTREFSGSDRWKQWRTEALAALNLDKVYGSWLTGKSSDGGWLECRDPDSSSGDRTPSAGVSDSVEGVERGAFHSFRTDKTISVFDFLVGQGQAKDFHSAVKWVAEVTGVVVPSGNTESQADSSFWKKYREDGAVIRDCVPILQESFVLLRAPDGLERGFSVNERNEAVFLQQSTHLEQKLHSKLKERYQVVPPSWLIARTLDLWRLESPKITTEPEPFCFKGDNRLCFKRFDWEPAEGGHPAWSEFLNRLSDAEAFKAFVWSCFEVKNRSRQYLWLRGDGQDGKSVVLGVIREVFGMAATAINNSHIKTDSRFLYSTFYGKRVLLYPDCKNTKFGMTEIVRNCTSGDPVLVEFKNQTPFSAVIRVKLFVASNARPAFTSQAADTSRIIYIEVAPTKTKDDPEWEARLSNELPQFLWSCRNAYKTLCPKGGDIVLSDRTNQLTSDSVASFEEPFLDLFERHFKFLAGAKTRASEVGNILNQNGYSTNEMGFFKAWLHQCRGVEYKSLHEGRFYLNLAILDNGSTQRGA